MAASPEGMEYIRAAFALIFVIGLIFLLPLALKKTGLDKRLIGNKGAARLGITQTLYLDPKHKLVLVRHDDGEHLILIGSTGSRLISSKNTRDPDAV